MSLEASVGVVVAVVLAALALLVRTRPESQRRRHDRGRGDFLRRRALVVSKRADLTQKALAFNARYGDLLKTEHAVLARPEWIPSVPLPLNDIQVIQTQAADRFEENRRRAGFLLPFTEHGVRYTSYSHAVRELDPPRRWEDRESYRLVAVSHTAGVFRLDVARGQYFDHQDTGEILAFEAARDEDIASRFRRRDRLRRWTGHPAEFSRRCAIPGISTLTIRKDGDSARFFMHDRGDHKVGLAAGSLHVTPAGEFQPSGPAPTLYAADCNLWQNMQREYNEEFLGAPESWETGLSPDYDAGEPYRAFSQAVESGALRLYFLGLCLDPLSLKPDLLTCAVWDAEAFDGIFHEWKDHNAEGILHVVEWTEENVSKFRYSPRIVPAGRACLDIFSEHRARLLA